jgi:hypothetical protein
MVHAAHGHDAPATAHEHTGHAEPPPAPLERSITPAPEDYAVPASGPGLFWPVVWVLVAVVLVGLYRNEDARGPVIEQGGH